LVNLYRIVSSYIRLLLCKEVIFKVFLIYFKKNFTKPIKYEYEKFKIMKEEK
jgi:hypothetical protein